MTVRGRPPRSTLVVLALGICAGVGSLVAIPAGNSEQVMLASEVYRHAAAAMLAGEDFYAVSPPGLDGYQFIYPPIVVLAFVPHALAGTAVGAYVIQVTLNGAAAAGTAAVLDRALSRRGIATGRLDRVLIAGFALLSAHSMITLLNGQVTILLGFAFALGLAGLDRGRESLAGIAFGAAALVKVFPAVIGLWLLRRRAWRGVAAAIATGLGGLLIGALVLGPDITVTYLEEVLLARWEGETFDTAPDPDETTGGAQRQIVALTGLGSPWLAIGTLLVLGSVVAGLYHRVDTDLRQQSAVLGTIVATLLFMPLQRLYMPLFVFPLIVLLYILPPGRARKVFLVGLCVTYLRVGFNIVAGIAGAFPTGINTGLETVLGAAYTFVLPPTLGLWLLLAGCVLVQVDHPEPVEDVDHATTDTADDAGSTGE